MSLLIRPLVTADLPACATLVGGPAAADWGSAARHLIVTDPGGCWVAEHDGIVIGFATSLRRDLMWVLSSLVVDATEQRQGLGSQLLQAALQHGAGCLRGLSALPHDQGALRLVRQAGFDLHPLLTLRGRVSRTDLAGVRHVREGTEADVDLCDSLDRRTRDAAHGPDHALLGQRLRRIVMDHATGQGYAYVDPAGSVRLLAADSRKAARALLWEALAASDPGVPVEITNISAANGWALDVAVAARLEIHPSRLLATRHLQPPTPYVPHNDFL